MPNHARLKADLRMARATITQQNIALAELVAVVHDLAPNHEILKRLPFLQYREPDTPNDDTQESR